MAAYTKSLLPAICFSFDSLLLCYMTFGLDIPQKIAIFQRNLFCWLFASLFDSLLLLKAKEAIIYYTQSHFDEAGNYVRGYHRTHHRTGQPKQ